MEAIIAAIITAVASVIIAIIQTRSSQKQTRILREELSRTRQSPAVREETTGADAVPAQPEQEEIPVPSPPPVEMPARRSTAIWWVVGLIVSVEVIAFGVINYDMSPFVNSFFVVPLTTILLSWFRPVRWGYVALFTTILHGFVLLGYGMGGGYFVEDDFQLIALLFIGNAVVCAVISYFRLRRQMKSTSQ
jgi:hypothetical protein